MQLDLIRTRHKGEKIDGQLLVDGQKLCDTSECREGALQPGTYQVIRHFCHQYNRYVPLIQVLSVKHVKRKAPAQITSFCQACTKQKYVTNNSVLPMYCPQLKMGNGIHGRNDGSIILGTRIIPGCLKHTREPYENLSERIRKISGRGNEITLTIKDI